MEGKPTENFRYDSYCGLFCGSCFVMLSYQQKRLIVPERWRNQITDMKMTCHGCKSSDVFKNCQGCQIRPCAQAKNLEFCIECADYPCALYEGIHEANYAHHNVAVCRMHIMKEKGIHAWMQYQQNRWTCKQCGTLFSWYETQCPKCGAEVLGSIEEEQKMITDEIIRQKKT